MKDPLQKNEYLLPFCLLFDSILISIVKPANKHDSIPA
jgi:hypothetical protein